MHKLILLLSVISSTAFAAGGAHHGEGVPTVVLWQLANVAIIFGVGYYLFAKKIVNAFKSRRETFLADSAKSESIQREAEKKLLDIKHKIEHLENTAEESVARARAEAADLRKQLMQEAKDLAEKIRREAQSTAQIEIQSAKRELHAEVVRTSVNQAKEILKKDTGQTDQQRLQDQFSTEIEGVRL